MGQQENLHVHTYQVYDTEQNAERKVRPQHIILFQLVPSMLRNARLMPIDNELLAQSASCKVQT